MKTAILSIGNELLLGKTINTNQAWLGNQLSLIGLEIAEVRVIPDIAEAIRDTLDELWKRYDLIISTGGLGPTKDDITKHVVADYFQKPMRFSEEVWAYVQERFRHRGMPIPAVNRCQAEYPADFELLHNERGTAPGLLYEEAGKRLFILPGVPSEMEGLYLQQILPRLRAQQRPYFVRTVHTWGVAESRIAEILDDLVIPESLNLAYLPQAGRVTLRVFGADMEAGKTLTAEVERRMAGHIWGYDADTIPARLHQALLQRNMTLALAESCTGGAAAAAITAISGASAYFLGAAVTYANRIKQELLGVDESLLSSHGAVSPEVALSMASGCRKRFGADIAGAITGIAGPDGGTPEKPVGTVHIAADIQGRLEHEALHLIGTREGIRTIAAERLFLRILIMLGEVKA